LTTRRKFLGGSAALLASLGLPGPVKASVSAGDRKFIFLFAVGGWDTTYAFTAQLSNSFVSTEATAWTETAGDIKYVTNTDRPSTAAFFQKYYDKIGLLNGMLVRSVNHMICQRLVLTGSALVTQTDWPTLIGADQGDLYTIPSLVVSGPSFPGPMTEFSSIVGVGGQLEDLITGASLARGDIPVQVPPAHSITSVDDYLAARSQRRFESAVTEVDQRLTRVYRNTLERVTALKTESEGISLTGGSNFTSEAQTAIDVLSNGVSRCASLSSPGWDTHAGNSAQAGYFERLFDNLLYLMNLLETTPGTNNPTLADETVVVVVSELGRTPYLSGADGKDHWMYTSAMIMGSGIQGNITMGGYDEYLGALRVDLATGEPYENGQMMTPDHIGATLMKLADIDPAEHGLDQALDVLIA